MATSEFVTYLLELMTPWAAVSARRMFGGYGLYRDGAMFALVASDALYFKVDVQTQAHFEQTGSAPMIYHARNRTIPMSYWSAPAVALETPADMALWCALAYGAALRVAADRNAKKKSSAKASKKAIEKPKERSPKKPGKKPERKPRKKSLKKSHKKPVSSGLASRKRGARG